MPSEITTTLDLLTRTDFLTGVGAGVLAFLGLTLTPKGRRSWWGLGLAFATVIAINAAYQRPPGLAVGLVALTAGGWLVDQGRPRATWKLAGWLTIGIGALTLTIRSGIPQVLWIQLATPLVIVLFGLALRAWTHMEHQVLLGPLIAVSAVGIWVTVPDTETARIFFGASIPISIATIAPIRARTSSAGAFALAGVIAWLAPTGGAAREASIIGAWACLGLILILPMVTGQGRRLSKPIVFGGHVLVVLLASRLFGLWQRALPAAIGVVALGLLAYVVLTDLTGRASTSGYQDP